MVAQVKDIESQETNSVDCSWRDRILSGDDCCGGTAQHIVVRTITRVRNA